MAIFPQGPTNVDQRCNAGKRRVRHQLKRCLQDDNLALVHGEGAFRGKLLFPYGWGVAFSRLTGDEVAGTNFAEVFPEHQMLLREDLAETVDPGNWRLSGPG
jgi:hypothetical protein